MNDEKITAIRGGALQSMARNERWFKILLGFCGTAEVIGLAAVCWIIDWGNSTHQLIFAATMLVWVNLALWVYALAVRNRVGEQRILRAIDVIASANDET